MPSYPPGFEPSWVKARMKPKKKAKKKRKPAKKKAKKVAKRKPAKKKRKPAKKKVVRKKRVAKKKVVRKKRAAKKVASKAPAARVVGKDSVMPGPDPQRKLKSVDKRHVHARAPGATTEEVGARSKDRTWCGLVEDSSWIKRTKSGWETLVRLAYSYGSEKKRVTCPRCKKLVAERDKVREELRKRFAKEATTLNKDTAWPGDARVLKKIPGGKKFWKVYGSPVQFEMGLWKDYGAFREWEDSQIEIAAANLAQGSVGPALASAVAESLGRPFEWLLYRQRGASDKELKEVLGRVFGIWGGGWRSGADVRYSGGKNPTLEVRKGRSEIKLSGKRLIAVTREAWSIPDRRA